MSVFRSEIQVPINKGNIEARNSFDSNNSNFQSSSLSSPSLDQWRNKLKNQIILDDSAFSNNSSPKLFPNSQIPYGADYGFSFNSENFFRQLQTQIAKGNDENMHFKAKFDVKDIVDPDKIKVFVKEMSLIMSIEYKEMIDSKCSVTKEYTKRFNLPPNIISDSITCTISIDNILILDGILDTTIDKRKCSSLIMSNSIPFRSQSMVSSSSSGSLLHSPTTNEKYSICVHIGSHYNPQDISIKTKDDKIFIKARHEEKSDSRTNYREFSKEILLPERVDPLSLSAIFNNGYLSIEAPFIN